MIYYYLLISYKFIRPFLHTCRWFYFIFWLQFDWIHDKFVFNFKWTLSQSQINWIIILMKTTLYFIRLTWVFFFEMMQLFAIANIRTKCTANNGVMVLHCTNTDITVLGGGHFLREVVVKINLPNPNVSRASFNRCDASRIPGRREWLSMEAKWSIECVEIN